MLTCESGTQAVSLSKEYKPDIIIIDLLIPELDGLSAIEEIRKFLPNTCVIIISASADFAYAQRAIRLKVLDYLLKPIKPNTFMEVFNEALLYKVTPKSNEQSIIPKKNTVQKKTSNSFVNDAIDYIKLHFLEKLTLETVASVVFVNPKYFSHTFKKEIGVSFSEYVISLKIQYACKLLEETDYPAYRISAECGFSDASYFNKVFCSQMNITPQAYRKNLHYTKHKY